MENLSRAIALLDDEPDEAHAIASELLNDDPDNAGALHVIAVLESRAGRSGKAIGLWERLARLRPTRAEVWSNLGQSLCECCRFAEARNAFKRALELKDSADTLADIAVAYNEDGQFVEGMKWSKRALSKCPGHKAATAVLGFSKLALGDWSGWVEFQASAGTKHRVGQKYAPDWDGKPVGSLIVYGEQGIGDEIMFASCVPDATRLAERVSIECDPRLEGLFRRSFPQCDVYGTRRLEKQWKGEFDAQASSGFLPSLFRPTRDSCPRQPYLTADPERRTQWRALFRSFGKPVIGLTWTGGNKFTKRTRRNVGLDAFKPVIETLDAVYVSLQYKDASDEIAASGLPVRQFPWATLTDDYDDVAAMVAEMDLVIGIHTSAHHLAGALGVPSVILVPSKPMWNYATGDGLPWYGHQPFHRQKPDETWADCVKRLDVVAHLEKWKEAA